MLLVQVYAVRRSYCCYTNFVLLEEVSAAVEDFGDNAVNMIRKGLQIDTRDSRKDSN